jgi:hypothetical protein
MIADLRPALTSYLLADAAVSALVGGVRVHPGVLPQGERQPTIVYNLVSEVTDHHMLGPSGLVMVRVQIDAWAQTPDAADALARAIKLRIDGAAGDWTYGDDSPPDNLQVQGVFADTARWDYAADIGMHRASRDYLIHYGER